MRENIPSYVEYASGKLPTNYSKVTSPSTRMRVLRRNRSKRVDLFLDWLVRLFRSIEAVAADVL